MCKASVGACPLAAHSARASSTRTASAVYRTKPMSECVSANGLFLPADIARRFLGVHGFARLGFFWGGYSRLRQAYTRRVSTNTLPTIAHRNRRHNCRIASPTPRVLCVESFLKVPNRENVF